MCGCDDNGGGRVYYKKQALKRMAAYFTRSQKWLDVQEWINCLTWNLNLSLTVDQLYN